MRSFVCAFVLLVPLLVVTPTSAQEPPAGPAMLVTSFERAINDDIITGGPRISVIEPDGSTRRLSPRDGSMASWSPDGSTVAYTDFDLRLIDRDGGRDRLLLPQAEPAQEAFSPTGAEVLAVQALESLVAVDVVTGEV